jgi:hypothetical protein
MVVNFPLGRPLGRPNDAVFQTEVLKHALSMLDAPSGPVWREFPHAVADADVDEQVSCALPPRLNPQELPAVDEAQALQSAYRRTVEANGGRTNFGRVLNHESLLDALRALDRIANHGVMWNEAGLPSDTIQTTIDIRAYYIEAAMSLVEDVREAVASAWGFERWFYRQTETGKLVVAARAAMKDAGVANPIWTFMSSMDA